MRISRNKLVARFLLRLKSQRSHIFVVVATPAGRCNAASPTGDFRRKLLSRLDVQKIYFVLLPNSPPCFVGVEFL